MIWLLTLPFRIVFGTIRTSLRLVWRTGRILTRPITVGFGLGAFAGYVIGVPEARERALVVLDSVSGGARSDRLEAAVREALARSASTADLTQPDVSVVGRIVTLTGSVPNGTAMGDLERVAGEVPGVSQVVGRLDVEPTEVEPPDPSA